MTFLEEDDSDSLIVAATNNVGMLDEALFRRFDDIVVYQHPTEVQAKELVENRLSMFDSSFDWDVVMPKVRGLSHAEICRACDDAAKNSILAGSKEISNDVFLRAIVARRTRLEIYSAKD